MKRPVLVTVTSILIFLVGALQTLVGAIVLAKHNDAKFLADANATPSKLQALGIVLVVFGVISLLMAVGLARGSRLARAIVSIGMLGQIASGVYTLVTLKGSNRSTGIGMIVGALIGLYLLFGTEKAKSFFAK
jgi:hypothetical protein